MLTLFFAPRATCDGESHLFSLRTLSWPLCVMERECKGRDLQRANVNVFFFSFQIQDLCGGITSLSQAACMMYHNKLH